MSQLLKSRLLISADRLFVGEICGPETLDLLMAWNAGLQGGLANMNASDSLRALQRLEYLASKHLHKPQQITKLIAEAVQLVIFVKKPQAAIKFKNC